MMWILLVLVALAILIAVLYDSRQKRLDYERTTTAVKAATKSIGKSQPKVEKDINGYEVEKPEERRYEDDPSQWEPL